MTGPYPDMTKVSPKPSMRGTSFTKTRGRKSTRAKAIPRRLGRR